MSAVRISHYTSPSSLHQSPTLIIPVPPSHYTSPPSTLYQSHILITPIPPSHYTSPSFSLHQSLLLITPVPPPHYTRPSFSLHQTLILTTPVAHSLSQHSVQFVRLLSSFTFYLYTKKLPNSAILVKVTFYTLFPHIYSTTYYFRPDCDASLTKQPRHLHRSSHSRHINNNGRLHWKPRSGPSQRVSQHATMLISSPHI
jgi:hypothetical protein